MEKTLEELAREYVYLLNSPPNGWGQHVHPIYGQSHAMMWHMIKTFGDIETYAAIHDAERGED
jgi:hypothetical protein